MRPIISSKKHIVQISQGTVAQAAVTVQVLADAIEGTPTSPVHLKEGAIVKAVYVELWIQNDSSTVVGSYTCILFKNPGAGHTPTTGVMAALHDYQNKKNILFTSQALAPASDSAVIPIMRGWYKIPKGKQRFGLRDQIAVALRNNNATSVAIQFCGSAIYKEYV